MITGPSRLNGYAGVQPSSRTPGEKDAPVVIPVRRTGGPGCDIPTAGHYGWYTCGCVIVSGSNPRRSRIGRLVANASTWR